MNRKTSLAIAAACICATAATPALAQQRQQQQPRQNVQSSRVIDYLESTPATEQPDVLLDISNLSVEEITLEVENVEARLALDARVANLVRLNAGADVSIGNVNLTIKGVQAQAALIVRLDNVRAIVERTLTTLENNPEIIETLGNTINQTVDTTGNLVNNTVGTVGDLTQSVLSNGRLLDLAGSGLSVVSQTVNAAGETVRSVRSGNGQLYEVVTDSAGRILRSTRR